MKYYINLIKRKKYLILLSMLVIFMISVNGIFSIIYNETIDADDKFLISILCAVGIYISLFHIPITSKYAQDDDDYELKSQDGGKIYLKFKKLEFIIEKHSFKENHFFSKDKNGKYVSFIKRHQIYNYIKNKVIELMKEGKEKYISKNEIRTNFNNVIFMNEAEKNWYIMKKREKSKKNKGLSLLSTLIYSFFGIFLIGAIAIKNIQDIIWCVILFFIFQFIVKKIYKLANSEKRWMKILKEKGAYIADCYVYDKKIIDTAEGETIYEIKIKDDKEVYVLDWIYISKEDYECLENSKTKVVIFDKNKFKNIEIIVEKINEI